MRSFIRGVMLVALTATAFGCACDVRMESAASSGTQTKKASDTKACVMQSAGHAVLRLAVPADAKCTTKDGSLDMVSRDRYVEVWLVSGAKTVDEAVGRVGEQIADEFKDFKPTEKSDTTIAGAPARRLLGSGNEADDGDPGQADAVVFKVGGHVFVACTHGESLASASRQWMTEVLRTAQAP